MDTDLFAIGNKVCVPLTVDKITNLCIFFKTMHKKLISLRRYEFTWTLPKVGEDFLLSSSILDKSYITGINTLKVRGNSLMRAIWVCKEDAIPIVDLTFEQDPLSEI